MSRSLVIIAAVAVIMGACQPEPTATSAPTATATPTPRPTPTPFPDLCEDDRDCIYGNEDLISPITQA